MSMLLFPFSIASEDNAIEWISTHEKKISTIVETSDPDYDPVKHASIFVSIAAYRDPECVNTVLQIFEQSQFPDRLRVGIFTQDNITDVDCTDFKKVLNCDVRNTYDFMFDENEEIDEKTNFWTQKYREKPHVLCGRLWQIKIERIQWRNGLGPTYGRYRAELFYDNEEYVLQMDSHTAFAKDWDTILIAMHMQTNNDYAVLTTYPRPLRHPTLWHWEPPAADSHQQMYVICLTKILKDKVTKSFKLEPARVIQKKESPILTVFFAAGFSFQKGHRLKNVPYDPYSAFLFDGEEMSMAVRMWTHGYDFYSPNADVAYHLYSPNNNKIRPVFWETEWSTKWKTARESEYRINFIIGLSEKFHPHVPWTSIDLREYLRFGVGEQRKVSDFWKFARIDLDKYLSEDMCPLFEAGGMDAYRVPWKDIDKDPYRPITHPTSS